MQSKEAHAQILGIFRAIDTLQLHNQARLVDSGHLRGVTAEILAIRTSLYKISTYFGISDPFLNSVEPAIRAQFKPGKFSVTLKI